LQCFEVGDARLLRRELQPENATFRKLVDELRRGVVVTLRAPGLCCKRLNLVGEGHAGAHPIRSSRNARPTAAGVDLSDRS
jgi:hypothetical protein